jgi:hypothetical protein
LPSGADAADDLALREQTPELEAESRRHRLAGLDIFIAAINDAEGDDIDELQQRLKREQADNEDLEELWEDSELRLQNEEHMLHDNDNMTLTENGQWFPTPLLEKGRATEMSRLMAFRTFEEISREEADRLVREEGAKYVSSRWEDQTKGNEARSRWVLRQFATKTGHESFYYSPVPGQLELQVACCYASLMKFPMHFLDVSTACVHSPSDEILITEARVEFQKPNTV